MALPRDPRPDEQWPVSAAWPVGELPVSHGALVGDGGVRTRGYNCGFGWTSQNQLYTTAAPPGKDALPLETARVNHKSSVMVVMVLNIMVIINVISGWGGAKS